MKIRLLFLASTGILVLALLATSFASPAAWAAGPWYVAPGGNDFNDCLTPSTACATINSALGKADSGDTILVASGSYTGAGDEVVLADRNATLSGGWNATFDTQDGASAIDGQGVRSGMTVSSGVAVNIDRFTVLNGNRDSVGGGILNYGDLTITNSLVTDNSATFGGGIWSSGTGVSMLIMNSTLSSNSATLGDGGGIVIGIGSVATIANSTVSGNIAAGNGAGIWSNGILTVVDSTISDNSAARIGGGIVAELGTFDYPGALTLSGSTISGNSAGISAGGIWNNGRSTDQQGNLRVTSSIANSTLSGNSADSEGGAFVHRSGIATLDNVTIVNNMAAPGAGILSESPLTISKSIIASNTGGNCAGSAPVTSAGYNLDSESTCGFGSTGDLANTDPILGLLHNNGGPTETHALLAGSPAIDAIQVADCIDLDGTPVTTDQRGVLRPQGEACDIGAFELEMDVVDPFCPTTLDDFNRRNGRLGSQWAGARRPENYKIRDEQVQVLTGGAIYWKPEVFGADQDACVTLQRIDSSGDHRLLLKVQGVDRPSYRKGAIAVAYDPAGVLRLEIYRPKRGWTTLASFGITLQDGDQLGGRALGDGTVQAFVNGQLIGEAHAGSFFEGRGGSIGLWFSSPGDPHTILDDFGGG